MMTRALPTIAEAYTTKRAAFVLHTPFGVLLAADIHDLVKSTARDAGVTMADVLKEVGCG